MNLAPVVVPLHIAAGRRSDGVAEARVLVQFENQLNSLGGIVVDEEVGAGGGAQAFEADAGADAGKAQSHVIEDLGLRS